MGCLWNDVFSSEGRRPRRPQASSPVNGLLTCRSCNDAANNLSGSRIKSAAEEIFKHEKHEKSETLEKNITISFVVFVSFVYFVLKKSERHAREPDSSAIIDTLWTRRRQAAALPEMLHLLHFHAEPHRAEQA